MRMRRYSLAILLCSLLVVGSAGCSAGGSDSISDADLDRIAERLEKSGKLEAAIARVFEARAARQMKEEQAARAKGQAAADAKAAKARAVSGGRDRIHGDPKARYSLIVYSDFECPYCKRFAGAAEKAAELFGPSANVVFRHFPLPMHNPVAETEHAYAECVGRQAGDKGFFAFSNELFSLTQANSRGVPGGEPSLIALAAKHGAKDAAALKACAKSPAALSVVSSDVADGSAAGVSGTPATILRDNSTGASRLVPGALPPEQIARALSEMASAPQAPKGK